MNPTEDELRTMLSHGGAQEHGNSRDSTSGVRPRKAGKVGEPYTKDAAKRNQSTEGQGNVKSDTRTPHATNKNAKYAPYKNKLEHSYAAKLTMDLHAGLILGWGYECMTLKLAAGKYHRPDFTVWRLDGTVEQAQTKGYHKNMRASMTGLIWAAQRHPWFTFTLHRYKNGWISEEVTP